jgi:hypothetical protein
MAEVNRSRSALVSDREVLRKDLARVTKQIDILVEAILEGADALALNTRIKLLEGQKAALEDKLAASPDAEPLLHPALAEIYRDTVERLRGDLAGILAISKASRNESYSSTDRALQIKMVAGACNQRYLHLDHAIL